MSEMINKYIEVRDRMRLQLIEYHNRELMWLDKPSRPNKTRLRRLARHIRKSMAEMMKLMDERTKVWVEEYNAGLHPRGMHYALAKKKKKDELDPPGGSS